MSDKYINVGRLGRFKTKCDANYKLYKHCMCLEVKDNSNRVMERYLVTVYNHDPSPVDGSVDGFIARLCGQLSNNYSPEHLSDPLQIEYGYGNYVKLLLDYQVYYSHSGSTYTINFGYNTDDLASGLEGERNQYFNPNQYYHYISFNSSRYTVHDDVMEC